MSSLPVSILAKLAKHTDFFLNSEHPILLVQAYYHAHPVVPSQLTYFTDKSHVVDAAQPAPVVTQLVNQLAHAVVVFNDDGAPSHVLAIQLDPLAQVQLPSEPTFF